MFLLLIVRCHATFGVEITACSPALLIVQNNPRFNKEAD